MSPAIWKASSAVDLAGLPYLAAVTPASSLATLASVWMRRSRRNVLNLVPRSGLDVATLATHPVMMGPVLTHLAMRR